MKIYYTRHGETIWNAENKVCGITDISLTEKGLQQARLLSEKVDVVGDIDIIISSPLSRARETAGIIANKIGKDVIIDARFSEWDYGKYEGIDRYASYEEGKPMFQEAKLEFSARIGETGESLFQVAHRVYSALDDIMENYNNANVLIVSHGGVCRIIETYHRNMTRLEFSKYFFDNCELNFWET